MSNKKLFRRVFRVSNDGDRVIIEGLYQKASKVDDLWRLVGWRAYSYFNNEWTHTMAHNGWYKIHGNKKKDIGSLKLLRDSAPTAEPLPDGAYRQEDYQTLAEGLELAYNENLPL